MTNHIFYLGDVINCLRLIPEKSIHTVVTSPPYWGLRDYGVDGQIGLEKTPEEYIEKMILVFREVWRVLRDDGTLWLNLGDSYSREVMGGNGGAEKSTLQGGKTTIKIAQNFPPIKVKTGLKPKDLCGIPWRVALALQADGWYLRSDIIWAKTNPMPESVKDRPTKAHEYIFLLTKSSKYYYDNEAIKEPAAWERWGNQTVKKKQPGTASWIKPKTKSEIAYSFKRKVNESPPPGQPTQHRENRKDIVYIGSRNKRTVWEIPTYPCPEAHFATFPLDLVRPCILAGTSEKGCCPKCGAPWERVIEPSKKYNEILKNNRGKYHPDSSKELEKGASQGWGPIKKSLSAEYITIDWCSTCDCGQEPILCTVLDPFGGSGTVTMVAAQEGRNSIYIDLNREYLNIALKRNGFDGSKLVFDYFEIKEVVS